MAYDLQLADRIRGHLMFEPDVTEREMFGGLAFLVAGHMSVAASGSGGLLLRVHPEERQELMAQEEAEPFIMRGRQMSGWMRVVIDGSVDDDQLKGWIRIGVDVARSQPPKLS